ncbi:MAG: metallophosphoesterase [Rikenellaceae bacterium]|nr:metallophosphoesterase [Rikenellaceae bacterium]
MDKKLTILHISDLHIADVPFANDDQISNFQKNEVYLDNLIGSLTDTKNNRDIQYLMVSGDITQTGNESEYKFAESILNQLCTKLGLDKNNVLIVPGNHDLYWEGFKERIRKEPYFVEGKKTYNPEDYKKFMNSKLLEFKNFYDSFYGGIKTFNPDSVVTDLIQVKEKNIAFLGINTMFNESFQRQDHSGHIDISRLRSDLADHGDSLKNRVVFVILHHTPVSFGDEPGDVDNWEDAQTILKEYGITRFLSGHVHTSNSFNIENKQSMSYLITGSIGLDSAGISNTYLLLEEGIDERGNEGFYPIYYKWEHEPNESGFWQQLSDKKDTVNFVTIKETKGEEAVESIVAGIASSDKEEGIGFSADDSKPCFSETEEDDLDSGIKKFLFDTIRKKDLYISGHFHWSKNGRSHSFLKTNFLFENYECLEKVKNCYLRLIDRLEIATQLLDGYAMQGSVIASLIASEKNWEYCYYPAIGREYSDYEKDLPDGIYEVITVVIDLVYTDNIVKWIVNHLKKKYDSLKTVNICTLFYTDENIIKPRKMSGINVCFYGAYQIAIITCPYKNVDECIICREKLDSIHILYSEENENESN